MAASGWNIYFIITYADDSGGGKVFSGVCLSVCLSFFLHNISKTDAARISELDVDMFRHESWKRMRHKNSVVEGFCTLVSAGFF